MSQRTLTQTPCAAERYPAISVDGRWLLTFQTNPANTSCTSARSAVMRRQEDRSRAAAFLLSGAELVSRSKRLLLPTRACAVCRRVERGTARRVDTSLTLTRRSGFQTGRRWRWLTYSKNLLTACGPFTSTTPSRTALIRYRWPHRTRRPIFDRGGKYLYFISSPMPDE